MPHAHEPYPAFSIACVTELWTMLRERTVRDNPKEFAKHVYTLLGSLLGLTVGEPDDVPPLFADAITDANVADVESLLGELKAVQEDGVIESFGATDDAEALDPATLAMLIQLAVSLITKWLERRRS